MPTTQPLDKEFLGDIDEGPLKTIAASTTDAKVQSVKPIVVPKTAASPAPPKPTTQSGPANVYSSAHGAVRLTNINAPHVGLNKRAPQSNQNDTAKTPTVNAPRQSIASKDYTEKDVIKAWQSFIEQHATEHLLVNAMRVAVPAKTGENVFRVAQSNVHLNYIRENLNSITDYIRRAVGNGALRFELHEVSEDSPMIWNSREVLQHIVKDNPEIADFILGLDLHLE